MLRSSLAAVVVVAISCPAVWATDLTGRWSGHWEDAKSGHCGPLHATFCPCGDGHYRVTFTGRFAKVIPFRYSVTLNVVGRDGDKVLLEGDSRLPLFGTFHYTAEATATDFVAQFCSRQYQGQFVLRRCGVVSGE